MALPLVIRLSGTRRNYGSAFLGQYDQRQANQTDKGEMPQLQGNSPSETQREEVPRVWDDPGATNQARQQAESLTAHHILCHSEGIERQR